MEAQSKYIINKDVSKACTNKISFQLTMEVSEKFTEQDIDRLLVDLKRHIEDYVSGYERLTVKVVK